MTTGQPESECRQVEPPRAIELTVHAGTRFVSFGLGELLADGTHLQQERNWFIQQCQQMALAQRLRISFVSGDGAFTVYESVFCGVLKPWNRLLVHCAAVGAFKTLQRGGSRFGQAIPLAQDHRYMLNVVTSAIVNTPPPPTVLKMVNKLSDREHKTMHDSETDEIMVRSIL